MGILFALNKIINQPESDNTEPGNENDEIARSLFDDSKQIKSSENLEKGLTESTKPTIPRKSTPKEPKTTHASKSKVPIARADNKERKRDDAKVHE